MVNIFWGQTEAKYGKSLFNLLQTEYFFVGCMIKMRKFFIAQICYCEKKNICL